MVQVVLHSGLRQVHNDHRRDGRSKAFPSQGVGLVDSLEANRPLRVMPRTATLHTSRCAGLFSSRHRRCLSCAARDE